MRIWPWSGRARFGPGSWAPVVVVAGGHRSWSWLGRPRARSEGVDLAKRIGVQVRALSTFMLPSEERWASDEDAGERARQGGSTHGDDKSPNRESGGESMCWHFDQVSADDRRGQGQADLSGLERAAGHSCRV